MKASLFKTEKGLKILCVGNDEYPSQTFEFNKDLVFSSQLKNDILLVQNFEVDDKGESLIKVIKPDIVLVESEKPDVKNRMIGSSIMKNFKFENVEGCFIVFFYDLSFVTIQECFGLFNFINQYKAIKSSLNL